MASSTHWKRAEVVTQNERPTTGLNVVSAKPLHEQLYDELRAKIEHGRLQPGEKLPSVQVLCRDLDLSITTVMHCFRELARDGWVTVRRGKGTFVAEKLSPTTEVLFPADPSHARNAFHNDFMAGIQHGFVGTDRHLFATQTFQDRFSARETIEVCRVRRADSVVVWRPLPALYPQLNEVGESIATVVVGPMPEDVPNAAHVVIDPEPGMRELLMPRIEQGTRGLLFVGLSGFDKRPSPYRQLREAFERIASENGIEPKVCLAKEPDLADVAVREDIGPFMRKHAQPGDVVFCQTPALGRYVLATADNLDLLSYTEWPSTVRHLGRMLSFLYLPVEEIGRAAAGKVLKMREGDSAGHEVCRVRPRAFEAGTASDVVG